MAYGDRATVMSDLGLGTDSRFYTRIDECLEKASELIDIELMAWVSTPLTSVPATITVIANEWAKGIYREDQLSNSGQAVQTDAACKRAKEALASYIAGNYSGKGPGTGGRRKGLFRKVSYTRGDEDGGVNL